MSTGILVSVRRLATQIFQGASDRRPIISEPNVSSHSPFAAGTCDSTGQAYETAKDLCHHLLLVSDNALARPSYRQRLEMLGYRVTEATSRDSAQAILTADPSIELAIIDLSTCENVSKTDVDTLLCQRFDLPSAVFAEADNEKSSKPEAADHSNGNSGCAPDAVSGLESALQLYFTRKPVLERR
ncbi:MAG: hypothetical protein HKN18_11570 [Silicimonas sp.]|nr:hypothetical protein [Silicimonas sp.]